MNLRLGIVEERRGEVRAILVDPVGVELALAVEDPDLTFAEERAREVEVRCLEIRRARRTCSKSAISSVPLRWRGERTLDRRSQKRRAARASPERIGSLSGAEERERRIGSVDGADVEGFLEDADEPAGESDDEGFECWSFG